MCSHDRSVPYRNAHGELVQHCVACTAKRRNSEIPVSDDDRYPSRSTKFVPWKR